MRCYLCQVSELTNMKNMVRNFLPVSERKHTLSKNPYKIHINMLYSNKNEVLL